MRATALAATAILCAAGSAAPEAPPKYIGGDVPDAGAIAGVVTFDGVAPAAAPQPVPPNLQAACGKQFTPEDLVVDPATRGLAHAVVYIDRIAKGKPIPAEVVLDQKGCAFLPRVTVGAIGSAYTFRNSDTTAHNVDLKTTANRPFNVQLAPGASKRDWTPDVPEAMKVECGSHPWMRAWLVVKDHPYVTVTDAKGGFRLDGVPPGEHTIKVWHESLGIQNKAGVKVRVPPGQTAEAAIAPLKPKRGKDPGAN